MAPPKKKQRRQTQELPTHTASAGNVAEIMKGHRTNEGTKKGYYSKIRLMIQWLEVRFPDQVDNDELKLPISETAATQFFGYLCSNAQLANEKGKVDEGAIPHSVSYVK